MAWLKWEMLNWEIDLGSVGHFIFGLLAVLLGVIWPFTFIFMILQTMDWLDGEDPHQTELDVAEYAFGLIVALIFVALV
jgi:hypothetical protein